MASLLWRQIKVLLYRNFYLKLRTKSQTIQEILLPIYFVVLLVVLKLAAYKPDSLPSLPNESNRSLSSFQLPDNTVFYVAPNFTEAESLINKVVTEVQSGSSFRMFASLEEMDKAYKDNPTPANQNLVGVYFPNNSISAYALRFEYYQSAGSYPFDFSETGCRDTNDSFSSITCQANNYLSTGFTHLQTVIDTEIIKMYNPSYIEPDVVVQRMPKPGTISNGVVFRVITSLYLVMAMNPYLVFLLVNVVIEKQRKIKEAMKMMGLSNVALWLSWAITYGLIILVMTLVMTIIAVFGQLFPNSNFLIVFLLFYLYGLSLEMFSFLLTTFFSNARTAGAIGSVLSILLGVLYLIFAFTNISQTVAWALSLLSPTAFAIGVDQISTLEIIGEGAQFSNLWKSGNGSYPLAIPLIMLPVDIILYFFLTLYFDNVVPGEYGQRNSIFFCFMPSFWFPSKYRITLDHQASDGNNCDYIEPISDDLKGKEAIRIQNITKVYKTGSYVSGDMKSTTAVNNFSLDIYEGQITALLGHNGAGKTTLFNILTGFVDATDGKATVFNYDVSNSSHMALIRQMTGVCPQHNILFDVLSVREHLHVFAGIKGINSNDVATEVQRVVKLIGLEDQIETFAKDLSGGQKRKLSVGIAIMGDPKILILDEPTAGMDPYSRRQLWDLLRSRKEGRITLLTTHFMDEADILADRKAIISKGKLRCVGSSLFLKNRFGIGYHLGVVTKTADGEHVVSTRVKSHIEGSELQRSTGYELGYTLPITQVDQFAGLFEDLEKNGKELGVQSFGVSMTTLEEVFLKIGEEEEGEGDAAAHEDNGSTTGLIRNSVTSPGKYQSIVEGHTNPVYGESSKNEATRESKEIPISAKSVFDPTAYKAGKPSQKDVYFSLVKKQILVYWRNPGIIVFGFILPIGLAIGSAAVLNLQTTVDDYNDPPLVNVTLPRNPDYTRNTPFLYKSSTGESLNNFVNAAVEFGVPVEESNLTDFLKVPNVFSYVAADIFQFNESQLFYKALYNTSAVHSLPSILNLMSQTILRNINETASSIITYNKRWPALTTPLVFNGGAFGGTLMAALAVVMSTGLSAINPVKERELKIKGQLRVSGVTFELYWLSAMLVDYCWFLCIAIALLIGLGAFNVSAYITTGAVLSLIFMLLGWGASCILISYCANFAFTKFETAQTVWPNIIQLLALFPYIIVSLVDQLGSPDIALYLNVVFVILIPYYVGFSGIFYISKLYNNYAATRPGVPVPAAAYFDWSAPMIPFSILMAYIHVVVFYFLLKIIDVRSGGGKVSDVFKFLNRKNSEVRDISAYEEEELDEGDTDDDVVNESRKVQLIANSQNLDEQQPVVLVHKLRKEFVKRAKKQTCKKAKEEDKVKVAVGNLSLSVYPGEVLGLLGPNGAGKTTAISVITADNGPTRGKVFVSGHDIQSSLSAAYQEMGYCSQDNPLWENLTIKEHLELYATTRGIKENDVKRTIDSFVDALEIREHIDKRAKELSGGTKRKLCFAMAMLGDPQVVLLDEPSTGMDPKTKRFMWDTISSAFEGTTRGCILTTHYMDEADALCSRVAIMVLGRLKCIGSTQHLKSKFGQGYILEIKLKKELNKEDNSLHQFVTRIFENVPEPECFSHRYVYKIPQESVQSLSSVFSELEQNKQDLCIEEYSFSQSTLEQVFLQFAREQDERDEEQNNAT
ncbi:unnamed protein product [Clavelina lepadiformis]|uniref:ABC transporter domain-containing protein n=1 Tax=Clavelina lepadiformis TaxID=159417 RepID=A0ABP0FXB9_CLALP